jgi:hypothetical protein
VSSDSIRRQHHSIPEKLSVNHHENKNNTKEKTRKMSTSGEWLGTFPVIDCYPIEIIGQCFENTIIFGIGTVQISGHDEEACVTRFAQDTRVVDHVWIQGTKADGAIIHMRFPHVDAG